MTTQEPNKRPTQRRCQKHATPESGRNENVSTERSAAFHVKQLFFLGSRLKKSHIKMCVVCRNMCSTLIDARKKQQQLPTEAPEGNLSFLHLISSFEASDPQGFRFQVSSSKNARGYSSQSLSPQLSSVPVNNTKSCCSGQRNSHLHHFL